jgi:hypothetical protein
MQSDLLEEFFTYTTIAFVISPALFALSVFALINYTRHVREKFFIAAISMTYGIIIVVLGLTYGAAAALDVAKLFAMNDALLGILLVTGASLPVVINMVIFQRLTSQIGG